MLLDRRVHKEPRATRVIQASRDRWVQLGLTARRGRRERLVGLVPRGHKGQMALKVQLEPLVPPDHRVFKVFRVLPELRDRRVKPARPVLRDLRESKVL